MIAVRDAGGNAEIGFVGIRDAVGNADVARVSILVGSADYVVFDSAAGSGITVIASPSNAVGAETSDADIGVETNRVTVTATGGTEPYQYAWTQTEGDEADWTIESPLARATTFTGLSVPGNSDLNAVFQCTVTDARGRTGAVNVTARAINYGDPF